VGGIVGRSGAVSLDNNGPILGVINGNNKNKKYRFI
jgi:hypothetical protein